jgi:hypothetical protein
MVSVGSGPTCFKGCGDASASCRACANVKMTDMRSDSYHKGDISRPYADHSLS